MTSALVRLNNKFSKWRHEHDILGGEQGVLNIIRFDVPGMKMSR